MVWVRKLSFLDRVNLAKRTNKMNSSTSKKSANFTKFARSFCEKFKRKKSNKKETPELKFGEFTIEEIYTPATDNKAQRDADFLREYRELEARLHRQG